MNSDDKHFLKELFLSFILVSSLVFGGVFCAFYTVKAYANEPDIDLEVGDRADIDPNGTGNTQNGDLNSNTQNSNNNNKTTTNIGAGAGAPTPVNTAIAPSLMSSGSDSCLRSRSSGLQALTIGLSGGYYLQDEECNRRRDAKVFKDLGMSVAAVSRMCQNEENWKAMFVSGTPCPIMVNGKMVFGKNAVLAMKTNPYTYIPDYEERKDFYNSILGIGRKEDVKEDTDSISISDRFRTNFSESTAVE